MNAIRRLLAWVGLIEGPEPPPTEKRLAEHFKAWFEATYGNAAAAPAEPAVGAVGDARPAPPGCLDFQDLSYLSALEKAKAELKCLLVYLHAPHHIYTNVSQ
jgi:hypothetical protein